MLLGTLLVIFSNASEEDAYWAPLVLRTFSMGAIATVVLVRRVNIRVDRRALLVIALIGALDVLANLAYSVSSTLQLLSITVVLSSLFPVVTVALARIHLGERVTRVQEGGAVLTMAGVLCVAAGQCTIGSDPNRALAHAARVQRAQRVDRVGLLGALVGAVAEDAREAQRHAAGVARAGLDAVERDLDDQLGTHVHGRRRAALLELEQARRLPLRAARRSGP